MTAPRIGVVGAPYIAEALASLGFDIVTGPDFREAATAISNTLREGAYPVIVADTTNVVAVPWTTVTMEKVSTMIVLGTQPGSGLLANQAGTRLELPAEFNDLLRRLGYAGAPEPLGSMPIQLSGFLGEEPAAAVAPEPEPLPAPDPLPAPLPVIGTAVFGAPATAPEIAAPAPTAPQVFVAPATDPVTAPVFGAPVGFVTPDAEHAQVPPAFLPETTPPVFGAPIAPAHVAQATPIATWEAAPTAQDAAAPAFATHQAEVTPAVFPAATEQPAPVFPAQGYPVAVVPAHVEQPAPTVAPFMVPAPAPAAAPFVVHTPAPAPAPAPAATPVDAWQAPTSYEAPAYPFPAQEPVAPAQFSPVAPHEQAHYAPAYTQQQTPPEQTYAPAPSATTARYGTKRGEVIISAAGKGGVGKTSVGICLAEIAAQNGLQAILIDANRGQADIRKYLRLGDEPLPTVYDAYSSGDPSRAVLKPTDFAHLRSAAKLEVPDFGLVLGPPSDLAGSRYASASVYGDIIDYARSIADVVIIDTQIMEAPDERTDLWSHTVIPLLVSGDAWLIAITDESSAGIDNLHERLAELRRDRVDPSRTLVLASQFLEFGHEDVAYFQQKFAELGTFVGSTGIDDHFAMELNKGKVWAESPSIRPAIDAILLRTTNRSDLFAPRAPQQVSKGKTGKPAGKFSLFGKRKGA